MKWLDEAIEEQKKEWEMIIKGDEELIINIKEFDTRIKNVFKRHNIYSINQIKNKPRKYFEKMTNLGKESINIIMDYITNKYYRNLYEYE